MSQENLSPGNCVAATVFPKEIMSLTINVATVNPKEILSPGNTVARMLCIIRMFFESHGSRRTGCNRPILLFIKRTKKTVFGGEQRVLL